jgi:hypothetical protein
LGEGLNHAQAEQVADRLMARAVSLDTLGHSRFPMLTDGW